jgi:hypothetical protein
MTPSGVAGADGDRPAASAAEVREVLGRILRLAAREVARGLEGPGGTAPPASGASPARPTAGSDR